MRPEISLEDGLRPMRGAVIGVALGIPTWTVIIIGARLLWRWLS